MDLKDHTTYKSLRKKNKKNKKMRRGLQNQLWYHVDIEKQYHMHARLLQKPKNLLQERMIALDMLCVLQERAPLFIIN
jgi:hypothetical protein